MLKVQVSVRDTPQPFGASKSVRGQTRQRKPHRKSRLGCRNCKLRRIKCDEEHPECEKCVESGFMCNYDSKVPDLELAGHNGWISDAINVLPIAKTFSFNSLSFPSIVSDSNSFLELDAESLARLDRFQTRTVVSLGTNRGAQIYRSELLPLACSHPFLMHVIQTLTAIHDRYLSPDSRPSQTATELHHWSRAAALFNKKLSSPLQPTDLDALWATGALLGVIAFAWTQASDPEMAWPLRADDPSDLSWLKICEGKRLIWDMADCTRPDSVFHAFSDTRHTDFLFQPLHPSVLADVPPAFLKLFDMSPADPPVSSNPYASAVHSLCHLLPHSCEREMIPRFFSFLNHLSPAFVRLLHAKDLRALLLLAYWYAKLSRSSQWWITQRARLECRAICIYLDRHHARDADLIDLLSFPRAQSALARDNTGDPTHSVASLTDRSGIIT